MNLAFLTNQAQKNNLELKSLQADLNDELYGPSFVNHVYTGLDIAADSLFGLSQAFKNYKTSLTTSLVASGLNIFSATMSDVRESRGNRKVFKLLIKIQQTQKAVEKDIVAAYPAFKQGSQQAKDHLVSLVGVEAVNEVAFEIAANDYLKTKLSEMPSRQSTQVEPASEAKFSDQPDDLKLNTQSR